MTQAATLHIQFTDYWTSTTGSTGEQDRDSYCFRDDEGCPALPMTLVKGMLRETAERFWDKEKIESWFGARTKLGAYVSQEGGLVFSGLAQLPAPERHWFAAHTEERNALFHHLRSTAMTDEGVAKTDTLRATEVAMPMTIYGRVELARPSERKLGDGWIKELITLAQLTFAFGRGKNDGLGRALVSAAAAEKQSSARLQAQIGDRIAINLSPQDAAIYSRNNANQGAQLTHNGPTGAALWGWAISRLAKDDDALSALLSGQIHFSDAAPLLDNATPGFVRPAVLYAPKQALDETEKPISATGAFNADAITIGMSAFIAKYETGSRIAQAQALGPALVSLHLSRQGHSQKEHRQRTAHENGKAAKGLLFGYESLQASTPCYRAILCNAGAPPEVWQKVQQAFSDNVRIGKSRNTMYGGNYAVSIEPDGESGWPGDRLAIAANAKTVRVWCLSDVRLENKWGQLITEPDAADFGLSGSWGLWREECAVTTRRFAPWDTAIQGYNSEIAAVEAGSVFTFRREVDSNSTMEDIASRHGNFGERGMGWIALVPDSVNANPPGTFRRNTISAESDLTKWASNRTNKNQDSLHAWAMSVRKQLEPGGAFHGEIRNWPQNSQWRYLETPESHKKIGEAHGWDAYGQIDGKWVMLGNWLKTEIGTQGADNPVALRDAIKSIIDCAKRELGRLKERS
jgi:hypothetical protein